MNEIVIDVKQTVATIETNFAAVKEELSQITEAYTGLTYTDETMATAKADLATLRKIRTAIEDKRKEVKKANSIPYEEFEKGCKELVGMIDSVIAPIDKQVKEYAEEKKLKKKREIELMFDELNDMEWLLLIDVWNEKWLNTNTSIKSIREDIVNALENEKLNIKTISMTNEKYADKGIMHYKEHRDLGAAMRLMQDYERQEHELRARLKAEEEAKKAEEEAKKKAEEEAKKKAEEEAKKVEEVVEEPVMTEPIVEGFEIETSSDVDIQGFDVTPAYKATCHVTVEDENMASILKEFLNNYDFKYTWEE